LHYEGVGAELDFGIVQINRVSRIAGSVKMLDPLGSVRPVHFMGLIGFVEKAR
jgi:hypothetical protein